MGRKKGSKNRPKTNNEIQNTDIMLPGGLENVQLGNGDIRSVKQVYKKNDGSVTITIGAKEKEVPTIQDITPSLPADWDKMGKVERLKWLTANRK